MAGPAATGGDLHVLASSETEFHFVVSTAVASDLTELQLADSNIALVRTIQVAVPPGAEAALVSAEGRNLGPRVSDKRVPLGRLAHRPLVTIGETVAIRGRRLTSVMVAPAQAEGLYGEVEIHLAFRGRSTIAAGTTADDPRFEKVFAATVANYDQMTAWPVSDGSAAKPAAAMDGPFSPQATWFKMSVVQTGLHVVTGSQLQQAGLVPAGLASDSIRMFNAGGLPLDVQNENPRPEFQEVAIIVADGADGVFDAADSIIFYGEAVNRWVYQDGYLPEYVNNIYTDRNIYWLAVGGGFTTEPVRMAPVDADPAVSADTTITDAWYRLHIEQDSLLLKKNDGHIDSYYLWYWTDRTNLTIFAPAPGIVPGDSAVLVLRGRTGSPGYISAVVNGQAGIRRTCNGFSCTYVTYALTGGLNEVNLTLTEDRSAPPYFDNIDVLYNRALTPSGDRLDFVLENLPASAEIVVGDGFSVAPIVLDISNPRRPNRLVNFERQGGQVSFHLEPGSVEYRSLYMAAPGVAVSPQGIERVVPTDLHAPIGQTDLFVITPEEFAPYLDEYLAYRQADGYAVRVVTIEDIMDNFGFGLYDPTAIRDFLKFAYENYPSPAPSAVLFVGDASYDFRNLLRTDVPNKVPVYIHPFESLDVSYGDDNYVYFGKYGLLDSDTSYYRVPDRGLDMVAARWPVRSASEIGILVNKIKTYENPANFGFWRSRITLVADDEFGGIFDTETFHTTQTEELDSLIPRAFNRNKIYQFEYPFVNREKPAVNDAIVKALNDGTLLINYVGHGNPDVWAHEHVFQQSSDLPRLTNGNRLPLVFAASCAIGFSDDPKRQGMAEEMLRMSGGGAVATVSATRLVYSSPNASFNKDVYNMLLGGYGLSIAEAVFAAKLQRQYITPTTIIPQKNDRAFAYFGDPYLKLGIPHLGIEFTSRPDSLVALGRAHVEGYVVDDLGGPLNRDGTLQVTVYDTDREKTYRLVNSQGTVTEEVDYELPGPMVFRGTASINAGQFAFDFVAPLDISYGGRDARLVAYAVFDSTDALGLVDSLRISNQVTVSQDAAGPVIEYGFTGRANFISGDIITDHETLELVLTDSSGINLAGGLGHGITMVIDDAPEKTVMLTELFEFDRDDYSRGRLQYELTGLSPGLHSFKITAWDNANNASSIEFTADVVAAGELAIHDLLNYPNPMREATTFYFELTSPAEQLSLDIYTLSGKKIRSFNKYGLAADNYPNGIMDITWDGRDAEGDRVATGVYIYRASAHPSGGGGPVESFGKVIVIN